MHFLLWALVGLACYFLLVWVHELGHYLAGWAAGIPRLDMRIRLLTFPQHVALWDGKRWVSPSDLQSYLAIMQRHLGTTPRVYFYTAGGMLLETLFTAIVSMIALLLGLPKLVLLIAGLSLWLWLVYIVLMDVPMAIRRGYPWGDLSGLWWLAKAPTLILAVGMLLIRVGLLLAAIRLIGG
jgi:hypothetical protein